MENCSFASRLRSIQPGAITIRSESIVRLGPLGNSAKLPLVIQPDLDGVDLAGWIASNRSLIGAKLYEHGGILFRGFGQLSAQAFQSVASSLCGELFSENGEHPREVVAGGVYTPVFYPPAEHLLWHNENSFNHRWPGRILFGCVQPAESGGETPVVDGRCVFDNLNPRVRDRFMEKGVMYVRNYGTGLGLDWQTVFQTSDPKEVERKCDQNFMEYEWTASGLRTAARRPAAVEHPVTKEWAWFNQAQHWHISCLNQATRESISSLFSERDYPRHCYFGDGTPIADDAMGNILETYRRFEVAFPWETGDIMALDNILAAHARNAFRGQRKLLVAMGDMLSYADVRPPLMAVSA